MKRNYQKLPYNRTTLYMLAIHWNKGERTIRNWVKKRHPMLTHPESLEIIDRFKNAN